MRVAIFSPAGINRYHFETELELAQRHLAGGDEVVFVSCDGGLPACDYNVKHDLSVCFHCHARRRRGLAQLSRPVMLRELPVVRDRIVKWRVPEVRSLDDLSAIEVERFPLGIATLSSLVSLRREPRPDVTRESSLISRLLVSGHAVYRSMQTLLDELAPERLYVFNGRFVLHRAAASAAESRGVPFFIHERGSNLRRFSLIENNSPHEPAALSARIDELWRNASPRDREAIGSQFYEERARGISRNWRSFVAHQEAGLLPPGFSAKRRNIVIYVSSEDEFVALGPLWRHTIYRDQVDGVRRIVDAFSHDDRFHFTLRIHPNLRGLDNSQTRALATLRARNLDVVAADSAVSSYALLHAAEKVLSFGSTVGMEAVYWGKPSIVAGPSVYRHEQGPLYPTIHDEVISLIDAELPRPDATGALRFGYYTLTFGEPFRYFEPTTLSAGRFQGADLEPSPLEMAVVRHLARRMAAPLRIGARVLARGTALARLGQPPWL